MSSGPSVSGPGSSSQPARSAQACGRPVRTPEVPVHRDGGREPRAVEPERARDPRLDEVHRVLGRGGEPGHDGAHRRQRDPVGLLQVRFAFGPVEQVGGGRGEPAADGGPRGRPQQPAPARPVRGQLGRPRQRGHGRGRAAAQRRLLGGQLQLPGRLLVGADGGPAQVPGAAVLVGGVVEGSGERPVQRRAPVGGGAVVDGRPDQRVAEDQPGPVVREELVQLGAVQRAGGDLQRGGGLLDGGDAAGAVGGDELEQRQRLGVPGPDPRQERPAQLLGHGGRLLGALRRQLRARQLDQGERVPAGGGQQALALAVAQLPVGEQFPRRLGAEPHERDAAQVRQVGVVALVGAGGQRQHDRLVAEPAGHERQRLQRRQVGPVGVVDHAQHRLRAGLQRQQRQRGQPHQERVGRIAVVQAEQDPQRPRLRPRQLPGQAEHGEEELVQGGVGELGLLLHAHRAQHPEALGAFLHVREQRRLADAGLAVHDDTGAVARGGIPQQRGEQRGLVLPPQHRASIERSASPGNPGGPATSLMRRNRRAA